MTDRGGCLPNAIAGVLLAVLLLAAPVAAAVEEPPGSVPPIGTVVLVFMISDGMTMLTSGTAVIPPGQLCMTTGGTP